MEAVAIAEHGDRAKRIRALLDSDLVCREIVNYLVHHSEAADTVSGIAEWWINREVPQTASALTKLCEHGVVRSHIVQETRSVYTLSKSRFIRETLRQYVDHTPSSIGDGAPLGDPKLLPEARSAR
jgi:hypothetical protein